MGLILSDPRTICSKKASVLLNTDARVVAFSLAQRTGRRSQRAVSRLWAPSTERTEERRDIKEVKRAVIGEVGLWVHRAEEPEERGDVEEVE